MLEFITSRVWMIIAGLVLAGAIMGAFNGLDRQTVDQAALDRASSLGDVIEEMRWTGQTGEVRIDARTLLVDKSHSLVVNDGSIWVRSGGRSTAVDGPSGLVLLDDGTDVKELIVTWSDTVILSARAPGGTIVVQVEKVDATSFTASTNLLHSSSVL